MEIKDRERIRKFENRCQQPFVEGAGVCSSQYQTSEAEFGNVPLPTGR